MGGRPSRPPPLTFTAPPAPAPTGPPLPPISLPPPLLKAHKGAAASPPSAPQGASAHIERPPVSFCKFTDRGRFVKVMLPGFHQRLSLPPAVSKSLQKVRSRRATLKSRLGTWNVSVCRSFENDLLCFNRGWSEFVERHALHVGDFLAFENTSHLHFNVVVFDPSACEKDFGEDRNPFFMKTMAPCHATKWARVNLPIDFVRSNNLGKKTSLILRDPGGREWPVKLSVEDIGGIRTYLRMCAGWHDFYSSNSLKDGDTCVFELIPSLVTHTIIFLHVQILPP